MKIANIIYEDELVNHKQLDFINYYGDNQVFPEYDDSLPTLFVGWHYMKKINENNELFKNVNPLKHKIIENRIYWEFSFDENKSSHVKGVNNFVDEIPNFFFSPKYLYMNLDPVFYQIKDSQDLFDVIPKTIDKCYIYKNKIIYLLSDNKIYGIDIEMYKFFKFNVDGIISRLIETSKKNLIDNDGEFYQKYYKLFPNFSFLKRYIVVLLSK